MRGDMARRLDRLERDTGTGTPMLHLMVVFVERRENGRVYKQEGLLLHDGVTENINGPWREVIHASA